MTSETSTIKHQFVTCVSVINMVTDAEMEKQQWSKGTAVKEESASWMMMKLYQKDHVTGNKSREVEG